jgi:DNA-binding NarL/FixJ family response regulator
VANHRPFFSQKMPEALLDAYLARPDKTPSALTSRERAIVRLVAEGRTTKEAARVLNVSPKTIETHRATIMRKLGVSCSADLVRYAVRNKIIEA